MTKCFKTSLPQGAADGTLNCIIVHSVAFLHATNCILGRDLKRLDALISKATIGFRQAFRQHDGAVEYVSIIVQRHGREDNSSPGKLPAFLNSLRTFRHQPIPIQKQPTGWNDVNNLGLSRCDPDQAAILRRYSMGNLQ